MFPFASATPNDDAKLSEYCAPDEISLACVVSVWFTVAKELVFVDISDVICARL